MRVGRCFLEECHVQVAAHALVDVMQAAAEGFGGTQQVLGGGVDALALRRQGKSTTPSPAQHHAQAFFQVLDVAADGGHGNVQLQFGRRHAAAVGHGLEDAQQAQVDVTHLAQKCSVLCLHER